MLRKKGNVNVNIQTSKLQRTNVHALVLNRHNNKQKYQLHVQKKTGYFCDERRSV